MNIIAANSGPAFGSGRIARAGIVFLALAALCCLTIAPAQAAKWQVKPRIEISQTFTDNFNLDSIGKEDDIITAVNPGVAITADGRRIQLALEYFGNYLAFLEDGRDTWRNNLRASIETEVIRNALFVDVKGRIFQPFVDRADSASFSNFNLTNNRRETRSFQVNPHFRHRFGSTADLVISYAFTYTDVAAPADPMDEDVAESINHEAGFTLSSGRDFQRLSWALRGSYQKVDRETGFNDFDEFRGSLYLEYRVTRWLGIFATIGYQQRDDVTLFDDIDDVTWSGGIRINPNRRIDISASYGHEDGEESFSVTGTYRRKRNSFTFGYDEDITSFQTLVSDSLFDLAADPDNLFIDPFTGDLAGFSNNTIRRKRYYFNWNYTHRRTRAALRFERETRIDDVLAASNREWHIRGSIDRDLSKETTVGLVAFYRNTEFRDILGREDDFYGGQAYVRHRFSDYISGRLSYTYSKRDSNLDEEDLTENVVTLSMSANF